MAMRKQIVEGDPLKTGGVVLPSGATQSLGGIPVAYINGMATCFVCGVTGPIIKAGGGRRWEVAGGEVEILFGLGSYTKTEEVAMEDDEVVCSCPKHPQLLSALAPTVEFDDALNPLSFAWRVGETAVTDLVGGAWSLAKATPLYVADQAALVVYGPLAAMGSDYAQTGYDAAAARNAERTNTAIAGAKGLGNKAVDVWNNPSQLTQAENVGHIAGAVIPAGAAAKLGKVTASRYGMTPVTGTVNGEAAIVGETTSLYRGVAEGHPGYSNATQGIANPRGGTATAEAHTGGLTDSNYTSWTTDPAVARGFALEGSTGKGVLLQATVPKASVFQTQTSILFEEAEWLRTGSTSGAKVTYVVK
jgi:hypothetical protein